MPTIKDISEAMISVWKESTPPARFGLIALVLLSIAMLGFVGYWSSQPSFVTLISDSDTEKISAVMDELAKQGIEYEIDGSGGVLKVDQRNFSKARIAANKAGVSVSEAGSGMGAAGYMWMDKFERQKLATHEKARMLEDAIRQYENISNAKVLLNVPAKSPFERSISKPTASVQLTLAWGRRLTDENVMAIASTVASAVENLDPADVKITDSKANLYMSPDAATSHVNSQTGFVEEKERRLSAKAESQLISFFGPGNASVQISLDYTFLQTETTTEEFDSEGRVAKKENISSKNRTTTAANPVGDAGVSSNLTNNGGTAGAGENEKNEDLESEFVIPSTLQKQVNNTPTKNFMTVSVLVNQSADGVTSEDGTLDPGIKQRVESIVKNAVGFQEDSDTITVDFAPFPELAEAPPAPFDWNYLNDTLRNVSLAIAALVVFVLGMMTLRHFKATESKTPPVEGAQITNVNQLSELARDNPEVLARIFKSWVGENPKAANESERKAA